MRTRLVTTGVDLIQAERTEQLYVHNRSYETDAQYTNNELVDAAMQYLGGDLISCWPWNEESYKPGASRIKELVKAGALIAAEIDRLLVIDTQAVASIKSQDLPYLHSIVNLGQEPGMTFLPKEFEVVAEINNELAEDELVQYNFEDAARDAEAAMLKANHYMPLNTGVEKKEPLNEGHFIEARHTAHSVAVIIQHMLLDHPVIDQDPKLKARIGQAQALVAGVYQDIDWPDLKPQEDYKKLGEKTWQEENKYHLQGINPWAFMYGWKCAVLTLKPEVTKESFEKD
jgi:hypothetical protein